MNPLASEVTIEEKHGMFRVRCEGHDMVSSFYHLRQTAEERAADHIAMRAHSIPIPWDFFLDR